MTKRSLQLAVLVLASTGGMAFSFGGWAVITVDDLPQSFTVGQPVSLAFTVRQHGHTPLDHLSPTILATDKTGGAAEAHASAAASGPTGDHGAWFFVPRAGN